MKTPHWCRCDVGTIDYSEVTEGKLHCRECGRRWRFMKNHPKLPDGWSPFPLTKAPPRG